MNSELRRAIEQGNLQGVVHALDGGAELEHADVHGDPGLPLRMACFKGHLPIVAALIERGANIRSPNAHGPDAPIRIAAKEQHQEIIQLLLRHGAEIPDGLKIPSVDAAERRHRRDRRQHDNGPPNGFRERRRSPERRATFVKELELTDLQWSTYFADSHIETPFPLLNEVADKASQIFERARD